MFRYKWIIYIGIILLFIGISGALFNLKLSVVGKGNIVNNNYSIQYTKDYWYNNGYNYYNFNIILNNNLAVDIDGWSIQIKVPSDIQDINCWNTNCSFSNGVLTATNMYYNSTVLACNSVSFGIHFYTSTADLELNDFTINSSSYSNNDVILDGVSDYGMSASVSLTNSWSNGNQFVRDYSLIIYNDSGDNISGWSCVLNKDADVSIIGLWGASFIDQESIVLINGSNSIANGESIKINFQAASVSSDFSISVSSVNKS